MRQITPYLIGAAISISAIFIARGSSFEKKPSSFSDYRSIESSYLALGDSYTIGEAVKEEENFPNQLKIDLQTKGIFISNPEIKAVTGWTTGDLINSLKIAPPLKERYDLVTLLIGVNNQYQNRPIEEYKVEFAYLLKQAINFAGSLGKVLVLSIPDYSVTPYAEMFNSQERKLTAKKLKEFNNEQEKITRAEGVKFINITGISKKGKRLRELQAADGLHPSGLQYREWVKLFSPAAANILRQQTY